MQTQIRAELHLFGPQWRRASLFMKLGALRFDCSGLQIIAQPASHKSRVISVHRTAGLLRPGDICMYMHTYIHTYIRSSIFGGGERGADDHVLIYIILNLQCLQNSMYVTTWIDPRSSVFHAPISIRDYKSFRLRSQYPNPLYKPAGSLKCRKSVLSRAMRKSRGTAPARIFIHRMTSRGG